MTRVDLDAIEKRAKEATPGPWWIDEEGAICTSGTKVPLDLRPIVFDAAYDNVLDAEHIANMDPTTVLALVAELRAAREVVEAARWIERTGALPPSNEVGARRLSDLEQAVRAYDQVVAS